jgi:alkylation response protein AidB-like acyl-CoA dehydrogenase
MVLSAELTGLATGLLRAAVEHTRTRVAFGQPLAALQSVRHRAADMYLDVLSARDATSTACAALATAMPGPLDGRARAVVAATKVTATGAALRAATGAHQLCGGWGHLDDAGLHHYTRAIKAAEAQLGSPSFHRAVIAHHLSR